MGNLIGQKIFGMARKEELKLPGFPAFEKTVAELQQKGSGNFDADYQACVALADGTLIVKQALLDMYLTKPEFRDETKALLESHNLEFNPKNLSAGADEDGNAADGTVQTTTLTLDTTEDAEKILNIEGRSLVIFLILISLDLIGRHFFKQKGKCKNMYFCLANTNLGNFEQDLSNRPLKI